MARNDRRAIMLENAEIVFRNFSGKQTQYNKEGNRNFCVFLDTDLAEELTAEGWNVKLSRPRDEQDDARPYVQINVKFDFKPPRIVLITSHGQTLLSESMVNLLDWADIEKVDLSINPSPWDINGKKGIKGYVKSMYVTLMPDRLADKYYDVPETALDGMLQQAEEAFGN